MSRRTYVGLAAAVLSSALGGTAAAVTRFVIGATDPITLAAFRFGLGFAVLLPIALARRSQWPRGKDWIGVAFLGMVFFSVFFLLYNVSLTYTTAARGTLALSTLPLLTMVVGALLRTERLTKRKITGVLIAIAGVAGTLVSGLAHAPEGAWRGDVVMILGAFCMALYNVWSPPFMARSSRLGFLTGGMGIGATCVVAVAWANGGFVVFDSFGPAQWWAMAYLGVFGAALTFFLWAFALERATPTQVANTIAINPISASVLAAVLLAEPLTLNLIVGIATVLAGIWIASTDHRQSLRAEAQPPTLSLTSSD